MSKVKAGNWQESRPGHMVWASSALRLSYDNRTSRCTTEAFQYHLCCTYRGFWGCVFVQLLYLSGRHAPRAQTRCGEFDSLLAFHFPSKSKHKSQLTNLSSLKHTMILTHTISLCIITVAFMFVGGCLATNLWTWKTQSGGGNKIWQLNPTIKFHSLDRTVFTLWGHAALSEECVIT